jgi:DNA-binding winged helix-turn-helix (wHTH) protein
VEIVELALNVIEKAGPVGCLVLFAWLWMTGRIVSRGEFDRAVEQLREDIKEERQEKSEWKTVALRGTELAKYFGEKATAS